jgi:hypothetical protein
VSARSTFWNAVIIGLTQAVILVLLLVLASMLLGNQQQRTLVDIKAATRAQVCVLTLPVTSEGRDEGQTNAVCLIPNGIPPLDTNGDGAIDTDPGG